MKWAGRSLPWVGGAQGKETRGEANCFPFLPPQNGYTPLHQAAQQGHTHVINVLLQHGARPEATTAVSGRPAPGTPAWFPRRCPVSLSSRCLRFPSTTVLPGEPSRTALGPSFFAPSDASGHFRHL